ncbi:aspartate/glutamate racemase family protein [Sanguibacter antarcticus]|uniref:Aspartate racemase n=1 Tax=Sanguibacter antarcticus TaxID=372484 RepID=A0A2A9E7R9_9MICO|nr:aspartate/glutamate racemase family protein [Sanguibacter antarcticus]PFG34269.1 aspartate racemase [Sanguibacter antarcticus]
MKTIGLLGGMSWDSSATYYRIINEEVRSRLGGHSCAQVVLVSLDFAAVRELQVREAWDEAGAMLADGARRLEAAGADTIVLCTNFMHKVAPAIEAATELPLLHIADAVGARARALGADRVGLLGARQVMEESFYRDRLRERWGIEVLVPEPADRELVDRVVFDELTTSILNPESRDAYVAIIDGLAARGAQAVVLGCTEIGLLVRPTDTDLPLIDSAHVHALAAVEAALTPPVPSL